MTFDTHDAAEYVNQNPGYQTFFIQQFTEDNHPTIPNLWVPARQMFMGGHQRDKSHQIRRADVVQIYSQVVEAFRVLADRGLNRILAIRVVVNPKSKRPLSAEEIQRRYGAK